MRWPIGVRHRSSSATSGVCAEAHQRAEEIGVARRVSSLRQPGHFVAEMFARDKGIAIEPVHFRATGEAMGALVNGSVQAAFVSTALVPAPQVKGGKQRALGTTAVQRSTLLPQLPTFAELGLPELQVSAWFAIFAPAGTPGGRAGAAQPRGHGGAANACGAQEPGGSRFHRAGHEPHRCPRAPMDAEARRWAAVVQATGFQIDGVRATWRIFPSHLDSLRRSPFFGGRPAHRRRPPPSLLLPIATSRRAVHARPVEGVTACKACLRQPDFAYIAVVALPKIR